MISVKRIPLLPGYVQYQQQAKLVNGNSVSHSLPSPPPPPLEFEKQKEGLHLKFGHNNHIFIIKGISLLNSGARFPRISVEKTKLQLTKFLHYSPSWKFLDKRQEVIFISVHLHNILQ